MEEEIKNILKDEFKRLNRMNDLLEKKINTTTLHNNEHDIIKNNVLAMCEIVNNICTLHGIGLF